MKKKYFRLCAAILALVLLFSISATAVSRISDQIRDHEITVSSGSNGEIKMSFYVNGKYMMDRIGAESITVYEGRHIVASYDREDTGMSLANSNRYKNTLYFDGVSGVEYRVVVTVFAEDASGYDSRTKEFTVTAK